MVSNLVDLVATVFLEVTTDVTEQGDITDASGNEQKK